MTFDKQFLDSLLSQASEDSRQRKNYDMRTDSHDKSQRMLNALMPGTKVDVHRHPNSSESVVCLCGRMDEVIYDENLNEVARYHLCPADGSFGCTVAKGEWHTVEVFEPSVIFEAKDGAYGEDGSEAYNL